MKISKRLLIVTFAAAGLVAASASPAQPATRMGLGCSSWDAAKGGVFDGLSQLARRPSAARGAAEPKEPVSNQTVTELPPQARGKGGASFKVTVPVWFHVVHAGGVGNISQKVIADQMRVLDLAFGGFYGGVRTGFQFELVGVTRTDNAAWHFAGPSTKEERAMKRALHKGGWDTLNLYATTAGGYLGWAYFPGLPESHQYIDGIVVDWESMPGASDAYADKYDRGQTATHEVGHWFQLHHTFNGGCNNWGDYVGDTPAQLVPTNGCPIGQDTCSEPGLDPIHNYMDYSYDTCYTEFTAGQASRMQDAWLYYRA
jgi:Pregnancy-associated plasma protein-A